MKEIYRELKIVSEILSRNGVELTENVYLTDNVKFIDGFNELKKSADKKIIGYHGFDLRGTQKKRISINRIEIFKQITKVSECENLASQIFASSEEILNSNKNKENSNIANELSVFCSNYHPFDFYKFYEKRTENKINCSYLKNGEIERESFNVGNLTFFVVDNLNTKIDFVDNNGKNRRIDRKYNEDFSNSFVFEGKTIIFEFSGKSHYKSLFEMLDY